MTEDSAQPGRSRLNVEMNVPPAVTPMTATSNDATIGELIRDSKGLSPEQIQAVAEYQQEHGVRFGEAAVALGYASNTDIVNALSKQFHYPYAADAARTLNAELIVATQPFSTQAEAFRAIRSQLMLGILSTSLPHKALAVVSHNSGDGKSYFSANLGVALAQMGSRVLVVDADLRGPRLHDLFMTPNTRGLANVLCGRTDGNVIFQVADVPSLFVMPAGSTPPNPLELIERPAFTLLLKELSRKFDHILIDTPAAVYGADAYVIAAKCGAALSLVRAGATRTQEFRAFSNKLANSATHLAGVIVNEY